MKKHCYEITEIIKQNLKHIVSLRENLSLKPDNSYVSEGDLLVQKLVLDYLTKELPEHQLISEELAPFTDVIWDKKGSYVVLDPIDGTENFVSGLKEWGIGISIYTNGLHQESCIYLPELNDLHIKNRSKPANTNLFTERIDKSELLFIQLNTMTVLAEGGAER